MQNINFGNDPNVVRLLWTSGWDSTFRLLQLAIEKEVTVQPIYIIEPVRTSAITEIKTMGNIIKQITKQFPKAAERILPTYYAAVHDITPMPKVTDKIRSLKKKSHIGFQYEYLSRFALQHNITDLELSVHVDDTAYGLIKDIIIKSSDQHESGYFINPNIESDDPLTIFSPFRYPLLNWTKVQMLEHSKKIGTEAIMNLTWFCHTPINGKPCGLCNPCKYSIQEGMQYRFPKEALFRYRNASFYKVIRKAKSFFR